MPPLRVRRKSLSRGIEPTIQHCGQWNLRIVISCGGFALLSDPASIAPLQHIHILMSRYKLKWPPFPSRRALV